MISLEELLDGLDVAVARPGSVVRLWMQGRTVETTAMVAEVGETPPPVAPPVPVKAGADGVTALAAESPLLLAVSFTWNVCPTFTAEGVVQEADSAAGASTVRFVAAAVADTVCAVLASFPAALPEKVNVAGTVPL